MSDDNRRVPVQYRGRTVPGLFQRRRASGVVYEARVKVNGKIRRQTFEDATTTAEAVKALDAFKTKLREQHAKTTTGKLKTSFAEAYDDYVESLRLNGRAQTTITNVGYRFVHLKPLHSRTLRSIERSDVADLVRSWQRQGMAGSSVRSVWALGSAVYSLAIEHGHADANPFALARKALPPMNKGAKREVAVADTHAMLDKATERQQPLLALLALQGLRISEACGAHWQDIDLEAGTLHVRAQLDPKGKRTPLLKTDGSERVLKLDRRAVRILRSWKAKQMTAGYHRPEDFVLATASGRPTMRRQAHRTLQGVARRAGVIGKGETFRPHDLRAAFAVAALLAGDPVNVVQRMLGHKTSQMTLDLYGKLKGQEAVGTDAFAQPEAEVVALKAVGA